MPMRAKRFSPSDQNSLQDFECGSQTYAVQMANWIKGEKCLDSIQNRQTSVWLFYSDEEFVGFGSLGPTNWRMPTQKDPPIPVTIIPALAVDTKFQGRVCSTGNTYSHDILHFLLERAQETKVSRVVLYVHEDNAKAIALYKKFGFHALQDKYHNCIKMFVEI
ncbi:MAG: GNAT family N-acetyltransferase [Planctomycetales bacterium]